MAARFTLKVRVTEVRQSEIEPNLTVNLFAYENGGVFTIPWPTRQPPPKLGELLELTVGD